MTVLSADALLEVRGLQTWFPIRSGVLRRVTGAVRAVDGVDLTVYPGETLALVGESGCGKTTVGRTLLRLVEATGGNIWFGGVNLTRLTGEAFRPYRQKMQIVGLQQPPLASPVAQLQSLECVESLQSRRQNADRSRPFGQPDENHAELLAELKSVNGTRVDVQLFERAAQKRQ